jgi:hypothetical protein
MAKDVKNQQLFIRTITDNTMDVKKPTTIYDTYMWVLHI